MNLSNIKEKYFEIRIKKYYIEIALISAKISKWAEDKEKFLGYYKNFEDEAKIL